MASRYNVLCGLVLACGIGVGSVAGDEPCYYDVTVLEGPFCQFGKLGTQGVAINGRGDMVGTVGQCDADYGTDLILWTGGSEYENLGVPPWSDEVTPTAIASDGTIVGYGPTDQGMMGFSRSPEGIWTVVAPLEGGIWSEAHAINAEGIIGGVGRGVQPCGHMEERPTDEPREGYEHVWKYCARHQ